MKVHLIPTVEAWQEYVVRTYGSATVLHSANRRTACRRPMDGLAWTAYQGVTCKLCAKARPYWIAESQRGQR